MESPVVLFMRRIVAVTALVLVLLTTSQAYAQISREDPNGGTIPILPTNTGSAKDIGDAVAAAIFGYGGELPVKDSKTRAETAITALKTAAMLVDMLIQAVRGGIGGSGRTGIYLDEQAIARYGEALTYGADSSEIWPEQFTFDEVYPDGNYLEADLEQRRRVLDTQRTMQLMVENRQREFAADEEEITGAIAAVDDARGRNAILAGQAKVQVATLQQDRKSQQLLMVIANELAVEHSDRVNQEVKKQAQERYFLCGGSCEEDHQPPWPTAHDWGL